MERRANDVGRKPTTSSAPRESITSCGIQFIDDFTPVLAEAAIPYLSIFECENILKGLMTFALETPMAVAENLFQLDQVSNVNVYTVDSPAQLKNRNWQWVLQVSFPKESSGNSIKEVAWRKSKAVQIGRLMNKNLSLEEDKPIGRDAARLIIGYWIQKLYEARTPGIMFQDAPESVRNAYNGFLKWNGYMWRTKTISTAVHNKIMASLYGTHSDLVKNSGLVLKKQTLWNGNEMDLLRSKAHKIKLCCRGLGSRVLRLYLDRTNNVTLEEFRRMWGINYCNEKPMEAKAVDPASAEQKINPNDRLKVGPQKRITFADDLEPMSKDVDGPVKKRERKPPVSPGHK